jgi:hypothetical protein
MWPTQKGEVYAVFAQLESGHCAITWTLSIFLHNIHDYILVSKLTCTHTCILLYTHDLCHLKKRYTIFFFPILLFI